MRVAERVDGDAAEEIEVLLPVRVPHVAALTAHEHTLGGAEHAHEDGHCCQPEGTQLDQLPAEAQQKARERLAG